jgi:hypothetical protein
MEGRLVGDPSRPSARQTASYERHCAPQGRIAAGGLRSRRRRRCRIDWKEACGASAERVSIFYLHSPITLGGDEEALSVPRVLDEVVPVFDRLRRQGKAQFVGFTAIGDMEALRQVTDARLFDSAQVVYNAQPLGFERRAGKLPGTGLWPSL